MKISVIFIFFLDIITGMCIILLTGYYKAINRLKLKREVSIMFVRKQGFTLIELLVVIAIIAILAAILFPVFARAREKARQTTCSSNQRQIMASVQMYAQDHEESFPKSSTFWSDLAVDPGVLKCPSADKSTPVNYGFMYGLAESSIGALTDPTTTAVTCDAQGAVFANMIVNPGEAQMRHSSQCIVSYADGHVGVVKDQYALFPVKVAGEIITTTTTAVIKIVYDATKPASLKAAANLSSLTSISGSVPTPAIGSYGYVLMGTGANGVATLDESTKQVPFNSLSLVTSGWTQGWKLNGTQSRFVLNNGTTDFTGQAYTTGCSPTAFEKIKISTSDYMPFIATIVLGKYDGNGGSFQVGFSSNPNITGGVQGMVTKGSAAYGAGTIENYAQSHIFQVTSPGCPIIFYMRNNSTGYNQNREFGVTGIFYDKP
jgi:prepilin-type N-terminal cleavage/methylation domain-containing protein/prepilin-type processing-associated H-X9-DG protein